MRVEIVEHTPNPEVNLVKIARVSSSREDKTEKPAGLIKYLIRNKHWSPFEHSYLTIEIVTSRYISHQLIRHRSFTFQEFSLRYAEAEAVEPIELRKQASSNRQSSTDVFDPPVTDPITGDESSASAAVQHVLQKVSLLYTELLDAKVARECARSILPLATQTTLHMTGNARSWIHFIGLRDDEHAQKEAQMVARESKESFIKVFPLTSIALGWIEESKYTYTKKDKK